MRGFILSRLLQNAFVLFVLVAVMFFMFRLLPGDPVGVMASADLPPEAQAALRASWGLDRPLGAQFVDYLRNLLTGDFGTSFAYQQPVWTVLGPKVLNTLVLVIPSTILAVVFGCGIGVYLAWWPGSWTERDRLPRAGHDPWHSRLLARYPFADGVLGTAPGCSPTAACAPSAALRRARLPAAPYRTCPPTSFGTWALPLLCLTITSLPEPILIMRTSLLEAAGEDYIELVRAKGMPERVVLRHAARNSLLPVVTWVFHMFGYAIASTVLVEVVFAWPRARPRNRQRGDDLRLPRVAGSVLPDLGHRDRHQLPAGSALRHARPTDCRQWLARRSSRVRGLRSRPSGMLAEWVWPGGRADRRRLHRARHRGTLAGAVRSLGEQHACQWCAGQAGSAIMAALARNDGLRRRRLVPGAARRAIDADRGAADGAADRLDRHQCRPRRRLFSVARSIAC